jgi:mRNA-degrading endonuclease RelE of RelBE toxin-antitoxin system
MIDVQFTPEFKRSLRTLAKKYRHIRDDVAPVIKALQAGEILGDHIPGVGYTLFKVRVPNQDSAKGKRGGYRIIYYLRTTVNIVLVTIYSKTEQADVSAAQIRRIVEEFRSVE